MINNYLNDLSSSYFEDLLFEPNDSDVNFLIKKSLLEIKSLTKSSVGGNHFDKNAQNIFFDNLSSAGFEIIEHKEWMKYYKEYRQRVLDCYNKGIPYDFSNMRCEKIIDRAIIDKPNGMNSYPDILIIYDQKGMAFECKTSARDSISWGMTIPHNNVIYLFNSYRKIGKSTFFLGGDLISDDERMVLEQFQLFFKYHSKEANAHLKNIKSTWKANINLTWSNSLKLFSNERETLKREESVIKFVENFTWR